MNRISKRIFGNYEGKDIYLFTLYNRKGNYITVINYGAVITSWVVQDKNIVAGFDTLDQYLHNTAYFGCIVGRYANRIAKGKFQINGITYTLNCNDGENHLHGGNKGFDKVTWDAAIRQTPDPVLSMYYASKDGEEGFPGNLNIEIQYTYTDDDELIITYFTETDKATPVNITSHCYFNLTGDLNKSILDHTLQINAQYYTPVNVNRIPTGEIRSVTSSPFDFRKPVSIAANKCNSEPGYDHNFVLNKVNNDLSFAALLTAPGNELQLTVFTTEPGLQVYTGNLLDGSSMNRDGKPIHKYAALCLETQHFPDSPNQSNFPSCLLMPGIKNISKTVYKITGY